tara:strand:- start:253 stop:1959 length:1707 start_codon:yes stop_codon:yes gene_type:complete
MELIKLNNVHFAVGLDWKDISGSSDKSVQRRIKKEELGKDKESFHSVFLDIVSEHKKTQYASANNAKIFYSKKIYAGASCFVNSLRGYVVIKKIKEYKDKGINKTLYWFLVIDDDGFVVEDITVSDDSIEGKIAEYTTILYKLAIYKNDYKVFSNNITVEKIINEAAFYIDDYNSPKYRFTYYKKEDYSTAYRYLFFVGLMGIIGTTFFTMYETDEKKKVASYSYESQIENEKNLVSNWERSQSDSNKTSRGGVPRYTQEEFTDLGKKQVQMIFDSQRYENETILSNIIEIEQTIPLYLAEWKFSKLAYVNNNFVVMFEKLSDSNGVFTEIDYIMDEYDDEYSFEVIPYSLEDEATKRVYFIKFNNFKKSGDSNDYTTLFEWRKKQAEEIEEILQDIKRSESKISRIKSDVSKLNTFNQVFTDKVSLAKKEMDNEVKFLKGLYEDAIEAINRQPENYQMNFDLEEMTRMRYIEKVQINTDYEWVYPDNKVSYPNIKQSNLKNYADSYKVGASSIEDISNNFESLLNAGNQLTNMNTIIQRAEYDLEGGLWVLEGELFELSSGVEKEEK